MKTPVEETLYLLARAVGQLLEEVPPKWVTDRQFEIVKNVRDLLCQKCGGFGYYSTGMSTEGCSDCDGSGLSASFREALAVRIREQVGFAFLEHAETTWGTAPIDFVHVDNVVNERERIAPAFYGTASNPTPRAFPAHEPEPPEPKGTPDADGT